MVNCWTIWPLGRWHTNTPALTVCCCSSTPEDRTRFSIEEARPSCPHWTCSLHVAMWRTACPNHSQRTRHHFHALIKTLMIHVLVETHRLEIWFTSKRGCNINLHQLRLQTNPSSTRPKRVCYNKTSLSRGDSNTADKNPTLSFSQSSSHQYPVPLKHNKPGKRLAVLILIDGKLLNCKTESFHSKKNCCQERLLLFQHAD